MKPHNIIITREQSGHFGPVEKLSAAAFGPGRYTRTAFRLREGVAHEDQLSFVALRGEQLVGSVRVTRIGVGGRIALLLGPLVVSPGDTNQGIGGRLMGASIDACAKLDYELIILVGDEPYYAPHGFRKIPHGHIKLPGPVDPNRFLCCELKARALENYSGIAGVCSKKQKRQDEKIKARRIA